MSRRGIIFLLLIETLQGVQSSTNEWLNKSTHIHVWMPLVPQEMARAPGTSAGLAYLAQDQSLLSGENKGS